MAAAIVSRNASCHIAVVVTGDNPPPLGTAPPEITPPTENTPWM